MFGVINYEMFLTSSIILALIPGSDTMFILGQAISIVSSLVSILLLEFVLGL